MVPETVHEVFLSTFFVTICLSTSSGRVFFTTGTWHWTTGLSIKSKILSENSPGICLTYCFSLFLSYRNIWCSFLYSVITLIAQLCTLECFNILTPYGRVGKWYHKTTFSNNMTRYSPEFIEFFLYRVCLIKQNIGVFI